MPQLGLTTPAAKIGPHAAWRNSDAIVTMDPWGHAISEGFGAWLDKGYDVRPTIAITKAHVQLPECLEALRCNRLTPDGTVLTDDGTSVVTKAAIEPVWYLPGVAKRFGVSERVLRDALFAETNSMYPELISRDPRGKQICSMAWRCRFLTARHWLISTQAGTTSRSSYRRSAA